MFSLSLSRRQWAGCTAAQAKPSRHDKTIVVQPCSHPMPSPVLEKVRKKGIFVVFLRKEKTKASKHSAKPLLGPQPRLQASAVLSKIAKCHAREIEHARERREIKIKLRGHAAAPSWRTLRFQKKRKSKKDTRELCARTKHELDLKPLPQKR